MMFLKFGSQEERSAYGGSCFVEIQYASAKRRRVTHWALSSLYVHGNDMEAFFNEYAVILPDGDLMDLYGINHYDPAKTQIVLERLREMQPTDYVILEEWLSHATHGFYILGI